MRHIAQRMRSLRFDRRGVAALECGLIAAVMGALIVAACSVGADRYFVTQLI